jgi:serine/threonine-protein kinase
MPESWGTYNTRSRLGADLLGQRKFEAAEPLLSSAYEGLRLREDKIPRDSKRCLKEAIERLVQLYEAWDKDAPNTGKAASAAKWRKEQDAFPATETQQP